MEKDDALRRTDHYRCRRCGQISPLSAAVCLNPGCRAQLGIYGETIQLSEPEKTPVIYPAETPETTEEPSRPTTTHKEEKAAPEPPAPLKKQREKKEWGEAGLRNRLFGSSAIYKRQVASIPYDSTSSFIIILSSKSGRRMGHVTDPCASYHSPGQGLGPSGERSN